VKWKNGPLNWDKNKREYKRHLNKEVILKYLHYIQIIDEFINEV
jgi:hypothetical protein